MVKKLTAGELRERLAEIKLLTLDVDGVLTDGAVYYTDDGKQLRKFNVKDGMGIKIAMAAGVAVALVSQSTTPSISHRGEQLGIGRVLLGVEDKLAAVTGICGEMGIALDCVAHVGDDLNDIPLLGAVGCPMTVADAAPEVMELAAFVSERGGGGGAVRQICELLARAKEGR
jgi:3-deoxy-D-manno-octulosonate 8-phosphate phosphatase (KDO 8-P phosphatase)